VWQQVQPDAETVQDFVDFGLTWLEDRRYTLTVGVDMEGWAKVMTDAQTSARVNPSFNPEFSRLSPDNSFWLDIKAGSHTIAIMAARLFITDDYLELKRSTRLWYDPPLPGQTRLEIAVPAGTPRISGLVGHEGGLWVHPEHRKRGLSVILPHLTRALCLRQWDVDWQTGLTLREIGECGIAKWAYGMPRVVPCFEGFSPLRPVYDRLFMVYMSRGELLAGLNPGAVARLFANRHGETSHPAALVQKR
jgi:hypothetical protein